MSRSHQHTPIFGNCNGSEKQDKRNANQALRARARVSLRNGDDVLPLMREVSNIWTHGKDGKHYRKNTTPAMMRK